MGATELRVIDATPEHAERLAPWMRAEDAAEVEASHGHTPAQALEAALRVSTIARTVLFDDEVAAMFGVAPVDSLMGHGSAWLLTGELVNEIPFHFLRHSRQELAALQAEWPILSNFIDARYERALRWVRWLGAEVREAVPWGVAQLPFHPFILRRS